MFHIYPHAEGPCRGIDVPFPHGISGLEQVQWIRECFRKPISSAWMTKKLQKFIDNINSPWAQMIAVNMPEMHLLQVILFELQRMTHTTSLDDSVF
jgi:hypothetical protein